MLESSISSQNDHSTRGENVVGDAESLLMPRFEEELEMANSGIIPHLAADACSDLDIHVNSEPGNISSISLGADATSFPNSTRKCSLWQSPSRHTRRLLSSPFATEALDGDSDLKEADNVDEGSGYSLTVRKPRRNNKVTTRTKSTARGLANRNRSGRFYTKGQVRNNDKNELQYFDDKIQEWSMSPISLDLAFLTEI